MIDFERWDVLTALFPFTDAEARKPRPVLVISLGEFSRMHNHVIGCMITTAAGSHWPTDHRIVDLAAAGLSHASVVRWKVFTLPVKLLGRRIGMLAPPDRSKVATVMEGILGAH